MHGAILEEYLELGGPAALGYPLSDERATRDGWRFNTFQFGSIYRAPTEDTQVVRGEVFNKSWKEPVEPGTAIGWPDLSRVSGSPERTAVTSFHDKSAVVVEDAHGST